MRNQELNTITVGELRELLSNYDDSMKVGFACDYGDYHHTQQVLGINCEEEAELEPSAYSRSGLALKSGDTTDMEDEADDEGQEPAERVLVLSSGRN